MSDQNRVAAREQLQELFDASAVLLASPSTRVDGWRNLAMAASQQRNHSLTIESLQQAFREGKLTRGDLWLLSRARMMAGDRRAAIVTCTQHLQGSPEDVEFLHLRAACFLALGRIRAALNDAESAASSAEKGQHEDLPRTQWLVNYLSSMVRRPKHARAFGRSALMKRWSRVGPYLEKPILAILDYKNPDLDFCSNNLGDFIQTVAALRHLARYQGLDWSFDDPDLNTSMRRLGSTWTESEQLHATGSVHLAVSDRDFPAALTHRFGTSTIWAIYNGWFSSPAFGCNAAFSTPDNLQPLLVSFHLSRPQDLTSSTVSWLKRFAPVGCRDWNTVRWLANQGVECFFSGCLTVTLSTQDNPDQRSGQCDVDAAPTVTGTSHLTHLIPRLRTLPIAKALEIAMDRLDQYSKFERIRTSRLHCALPAWARNTDVQFVPSNLNDRRFEGLIDANDRERKEISGGLTTLLSKVLPSIIEGASVSEVRSIWHRECACYVRQTQVELQKWGVHARTAPARAPRVISKQLPTVPIVLAFDGAYVAMATAVLRSIRRKTRSDIDLILLTRGVPEALAKQAGFLVEPRSLKIIPMECWPLNFPVRLSAGISISTMDRLRLGELLPDHDQIIYLDCDTLVRGDLAVLLSYDTGANGLAARPSPYRNLVNLACATEQICLGLNAPDVPAFRRWSAGNVDLAARYFNAGVMVMSLDRLRSRNLFQQALYLVERFGINDQDALNFALGGEFAELPVHWNMMPRVDCCPRHSLVHWVGPAKPWKSRPVRFAAEWRMEAVGAKLTTSLR